jgi:hypothetical protein
MDKKKIIIAVILLAVIGAAAYFLLKKDSPYEGKLIKGSGPAVYIVKDGKKHPFTSPEAVAQTVGTTDFWPHVVNLSDLIVNGIPTGPAI